MQFMRFVPLVKARGGRVCVFCQPPTVRLVSLCSSVDLALDGSAGVPDFDVHTGLMSVPSVLRTTLSTLPRDPYLFADNATIENWRPVVAQALGVSNLNSVFKIGIAWQGSPKNHIDRWRSFPLAHFAKLSQIPGVRLLSLQKEDGVEQLATRPDGFPVAVLDKRLGDSRDFLDTAAIISLLDLVITPETAVAHLAGSLGARTWVALSHVGDWRWMTKGDTCPWYPSARLFRQNTQGDWDSVFRKIEKCLIKEVISPLKRTLT
jgi:hypothetical protein